MGTGSPSIFTDPSAYADDEEWHHRAAELRKSPGLVRVEDEGFVPFYALVRHAEVSAVGRANDAFLNAPHPILVDGPNREGGGPPVRNLVGMDGAEHHAYRALITDWFRPSALREREGEIRAAGRAQLDLLVGREDTIDFANEVAVGLPLKVILETLGVPEEDHAHLHQLTRELFGSKDAELARGDHETTLQAVVAEFGAYFMGLVGQRRAQPTSDLGSVLANATIDGRLLEPPDLVPYFILVTAAGHDTVSMVLAGGVEALARFPDQLERLRKEPGLIPNAIEEMVRWVTPTKHFMRTVAFDTELHGTPLRAGDWVLLSYPSANRDEEVFVDPFRFDVARDDVSKHVGFGVGAHFCIGAPLARIELRTFFEELVPRLEHLEIAGTIERSKTTFVATFKKLPIRCRIAPDDAPSPAT